jgi:hypothetical protein
MPRGSAARGAWARDAHRTPRGELGKEHHAHQANHAGNHANHAHHSETQTARTHSTGGIRIAANGRAYAHSGSMHQDGRRCMEVGTSNKWYTETASKQPAAHPPERPQNPAIQLITAAAHPPERPQKPRNPPHHRGGTPAGTPAKTQKSTSSPPGPIPDGKARHIVRSGAASTARAAHPM